MAETKVLIVDDDQELLTMLSLLFRKNGYAVEALPSGEKMLAKAREFSQNWLSWTSCSPTWTEWHFVGN